MTSTNRYSVLQQHNASHWLVPVSASVCRNPNRHPAIPSVGANALQGTRDARALRNPDVLRCCRSSARDRNRTASFPGWETACHSAPISARFPSRPFAFQGNRASRGQEEWGRCGTPAFRVRLAGVDSGPFGGHWPMRSQDLPTCDLSHGPFPLESACSTLGAFH